MVSDPKADIAGEIYMPLVLPDPRSYCMETSRDGTRLPYVLANVVNDALKNAVQYFRTLDFFAPGFFG